MVIRKQIKIKLVELQTLACDYISRMNEPSGLMLRMVFNIMLPDFGIVAYIAMSRWLII